LDHLLKDCHEILRLASEFPQGISTGELKLPKTTVRSERLTRRPSETWVPQMIRTVQTLHVLIVLAALDVYLSRDQTIAAQATNAIEYGTSAAPVKRFDELHSLLERTLALVRAYKV
jgi:hypothetical protein